MVTIHPRKAYAPSNSCSILASLLFEVFTANALCSVVSETECQCDFLHICSNCGTTKRYFSYLGTIRLLNLRCRPSAVHFSLRKWKRTQSLSSKGAYTFISHQHCGTVIHCLYGSCQFKVPALEDELQRRMMYLCSLFYQGPLSCSDTCIFSSFLSCWFHHDRSVVRLGTCSKTSTPL